MLALVILLIVFTIIEACISFLLMISGAINENPYIFVLGLVFFLFASYFARASGKAVYYLQEDRAEKRKKPGC